MSGIFGETRTRVSFRHALITPDGHVPSALPDFQGATPFFHITPAMGANLTQMMIRFAAGGAARFPADEQETVLYLSKGACSVRIGGQTRSLAVGGYAFCPAETDLAFFEATEGTEITCFRKLFEPADELGPPPALFGDATKIAGQPFLGNPRAQLKVLLPADDFRYDLAMNIFTYEPGATLPFVETHIMEHGLLMLEGQGVYRLEESYYPVQAGDVIWMAPYCPQWFVAMGDTPASYLYYKNVNRLA
jgi:(S)-ureidoglycine aminohydrolase